MSGKSSALVIEESGSRNADGTGFATAGGPLAIDHGRDLFLARSETTNLLDGCGGRFIRTMVIAFDQAIWARLRSTQACNA